MRKKTMNLMLAIAAIIVATGGTVIALSALGMLPFSVINAGPNIAYVSPASGSAFSGSSIALSVQVSIPYGADCSVMKYSAKADGATILTAQNMTLSDQGSGRYTFTSTLDLGSYASASIIIITFTSYGEDANGIPSMDSETITLTREAQPTTGGISASATYSGKAVTALLTCSNSRINKASTPVTITGLAPGIYSITASFNQFVTDSQGSTNRYYTCIKDVTVVAGQTASVDFSAWTDVTQPPSGGYMGILNIATTVDGKAASGVPITIDGEIKGVSPWQIQLAVGIHTVSATYANDTEWKTATVVAGQTTSLTINLTSTVDNRWSNQGIELPLVGFVSYVTLIIVFSVLSVLLVASAIFASSRIGKRRGR